MLDYIIMDDTIKTKTVIPTSDAYLVQAHEISRSAYIMPILSRRLLHLIMAQAQYHNTGKFEILDIEESQLLKALELSPDRARDIRFAVDGLMKQILHIETPNGWRKFHWVDSAYYLENERKIRFKISDDLTPYVLKIKELFTLIPMSIMIKLQSKYALRILELVLSNRGHAGKSGNKPGQWFTDFEFEQLRYLFKIENNEYKMTADFRKKVIDAPVSEINAAHLGIHITTDYEKFRYGRKLLGVRLNCEYIRNDERIETPATPSEREDDAWISLNEELYEKIKKEIKILPGIPVTDFYLEAQALHELKEHPDAIKPRKKRG